MARSAASQTDSESAFSASLTIPPAAQLTCLAMRPIGPIERATATRLDRRADLGLAGPSVRRPTGHLVGRSPTSRPLFPGRSRWRAGVFDSRGDSPAMAPMGTRWQDSTAPPFWPRSRFSARGPGWPACPRRASKIEWHFLALFGNFRRGLECQIAVLRADIVRPQVINL